MGVAAMILALCGALVSAVALGLIKDEAVAWLPSLNKLILAAAVRNLPIEKRERYSEEWPAHVNEYPGKLSPLYQALKCLWGGVKMEELPEEFVSRRFKHAACITICSAPIIMLTDGPFAANGLVEHIVGFMHFSASMMNFWAMFWLLRLRRHLFDSEGRAR